MADAFDLKRQADWEMEGVRRGLRRYQELEATADPMRLPPGKRLAKQVLEPLTKAIKAAQAEALDTLGKPGRRPHWADPIQLLDADKLAVITLNHAVRCENRDGRDSLGLVSTARSLAQCVRDQIEYERWIVSQVEAKRIAREEGTEHRDLLRAFQARYPSADRRVWARWRRKVDALRLEPWPVEVEVVFGTKLVRLLVEAAPSQFELAEKRVAGCKTQYFLRVTEATAGVLKDLRDRAEVSRPVLMPMIIPPNPWRYEAT